MDSHRGQVPAMKHRALLEVEFDAPTTSAAAQMIENAQINLVGSDWRLNHAPVKQRLVRIESVREAEVPNPSDQARP